MKRKATLIIPLIAFAIGLYQFYISQMEPKATKVIFIMGGPGSGKGVQSELVAKQFGFIHLSIGDVLRKRAKQGG